MSRYCPDPPAAAIVLIALAALTGCGPGKSASAPAPTPGRFDTALPMDELMAHVIDPASFTYWKGSGTEVTAKGERDLAPTTTEGWEALESGAATLIEAGNLLQLPGRPRAPEDHWNRYASDLTREAVAAKAAAEKHDEKGVFEAGARVYLVCTACHKEYVIDPGLKASPPPVVKLPDIPPGFVKAG